MIKIKKEALLITPEMIKPAKGFEIVGTFNPGAVRLKNGDIVLYVRVAERILKWEDKKNYFAPRCSGKKKCNIKIDKILKKGNENDSNKAVIFQDGTKRLLFISHFRKVVLDKTGFKIKSIDRKQSFQGLSTDGELGIEDPRITEIGDDYFMTYVTLSLQGNISTSCAVSKNCSDWKRKGIIFQPQNKDCVLFPEKIKGKYFAFSRPEGNFEFSPPKIWVSSSKDMQFFGNHVPVKLSEKGKWDYRRVGAGPPPIKTDKGWLLLYHGVIRRKINNTFFRRLFGQIEEKTIYAVGAALFDLKNPKKLIAKSPNPIITPRKKYEKKGYVNNVVFPTGIVRDNDGESLLVFSGGADKVVTVKKILLKDIMDSLERV